MILSLLVGAASALLVSSDSTRPAGTPNSRPAVGRTSAVRVSADSIVVDKTARTMTLYNRGAPVRIYFVALGQSPIGDKIKQGDNRTPEGKFRIEGRNPQSRFHLALRISYPTLAHETRARSMGVAPGGDIMIHGLAKEYASLGSLHRFQDWTNGCIAVTNEEIEEIWDAITDGTVIEIKP